MEFEINNPRIHEDELSKLKRDPRLKLWTQPHMSHINAYRSHSVGGQGLVLAVPKDENPELLKAIESGRETWIEVLRSDAGVEFRGRHTTQEAIDHVLESKRKDFYQEISKPYHPKKDMKAYVKTIGDLPFQEEMALKLVPDDKEFYVKTLGYPVSFICSTLTQTIQLTHGKTTTTKVIRALLTGYDVSAIVVSPYANKSLILDNGILKKRHGAEVVVSFTLQEK